MSSICLSKITNRSTMPAGVTVRSRLPAAPPPSPSSYSDDGKEEKVDDGFRLLGIRSSEIVVDPTLTPSYSVSQKRLLLAANSGGALRHVRTSKGSSEYNLRIVTAGAVTPTAGVAASTFYVDPSNIPISEWSTFAALFDEVKVRAFSVTVAPYSNGTTSSGTNSRLTSLAMGSFFSKTSLPSNIVSVLMADDGELISPLMVKSHTHHMRVPALGFAATSAPGGTPFYGCPGSVQLYATGDGTNSMLTYFVCGVYRLRGRL